jgi:hypothetical protein
MKNPGNPRIISAAIKVANKHNQIYSLPKPNRHNDIRAIIAKEGINPFSGVIDGFMTDSGKFVDRYTAYKIASRANQILPESKDLPGLTLTTQHLW